jgi:hypothetical protein
MKKQMIYPSDDEITRLTKTLCEDWKIEPEHLKLKSRRREVVEKRQIAHYFTRQMYPKKSLALIGYNIGEKDHATVLHSCRTINNLINTQKKFNEEMNRLERLLASSIGFAITPQEIRRAIINGLCQLIQKKNGCNSHKRQDRMEDSAA